MKIIFIFLVFLSFQNCSKKSGNFQDSPPRKKLQPITDPMALVEEERLNLRGNIKSDLDGKFASLKETVLKAKGRVSFEEFAALEVPQQNEIKDIWREKLKVLNKQGFLHPRYNNLTSVPEKLLNLSERKKRIDEESARVRELTLSLWDFLKKFGDNEFFGLYHLIHSYQTLLSKEQMFLSVEWNDHYQARAKNAAEEILKGSEKLNILIEGIESKSKFSTIKSIVLLSWDEINSLDSELGKLKNHLNEYDVRSRVPIPQIIKIKNSIPDMEKMLKMVRMIKGGFTELNPKDKRLMDGLEEKWLSLSGQKRWREGYGPISRIDKTYENEKLEHLSLPTPLMSFRDSELNKFLDSAKRFKEVVQEKFEKIKENYKSPIMPPPLLKNIDLIIKVAEKRIPYVTKLRELDEHKEQAPHFFIVNGVYELKKAKLPQMMLTLSEMREVEKKISFLNKNFPTPFLEDKRKFHHFTVNIYTFKTALNSKLKVASNAILAFLEIRENLNSPIPDKIINEMVDTWKSLLENKKFDILKAVLTKSVEKDALDLITNFIEVTPKDTLIRHFYLQLDAIGENATKKILNVEKYTQILEIVPEITYRKFYDLKEHKVFQDRRLLLLNRYIIPKKDPNRSLYSMENLSKLISAYDKAKLQISRKNLAYYDLPHFVETTKNGLKDYYQKLREMLVSLNYSFDFSNEGSFTGESLQFIRKALYPKFIKEKPQLSLSLFKEMDDILNRFSENGAAVTEDLFSNLTNRIVAVYFLYILENQIPIDINKVDEGTNYTLFHYLNSWDLNTISAHSKKWLDYLLSLGPSEETLNIMAKQNKKLLLSDSFSPLMTIFHIMSKVQYRYNELYSVDDLDTLQNSLFKSAKKFVELGANPNVNLTLKDGVKGTLFHYFYRDHYLWDRLLELNPDLLIRSVSDDMTPFNYLIHRFFEVAEPFNVDSTRTENEERFAWDYWSFPHLNSIKEFLKRKVEVNETLKDLTPIQIISSKLEEDISSLKKRIKNSNKFIDIDKFDYNYQFTNEFYYLKEKTKIYFLIASKLVDLNLSDEIPSTIPFSSYFTDFKKLFIQYASGKLVKFLEENRDWKPLEFFTKEQIFDESYYLSSNESLLNYIFFEKEILPDNQPGELAIPFHLCNQRPYAVKLAKKLWEKRPDFWKNPHSGGAKIWECHDKLSVEDAATFLTFIGPNITNQEIFFEFAYWGFGSFKKERAVQRFNYLFENRKISPNKEIKESYKFKSSHYLIHNLIQYPNIELLKKAIQMGASKEKRNSRGETPLDFLDRIYDEHKTLKDNYKLIRDLLQ